MILLKHHKDHTAYTSINNNANCMMFSSLVLIIVHSGGILVFKDCACSVSNKNGCCCTLKGIG